MKLERRSTTPLNSDDYSKSPLAKHVSVPPHPNKLRRRNTISFANTTTTMAEATAERKAQWPQISPTLYVTPESTPLPDSPTSFPPSPYIINHKRRGQRLLKSSSVQNVSSKQQKDEGVGEILGNGRLSETKVDIDNSVSCGVDANASRMSNSVEEDKLNGFHGGNDGEAGDGKVGNGGIGETGGRKVVVASGLGRESEIEVFLYPQGSTSLASSTNAEDNNSAESSVKTSTPMAEFFDACEELSSVSGLQQLPSISDLETELQDMRMSLLVEIEKREQAEDALNNMRRQWQILRQKMMDVGLVLPANPTTLEMARRNRHRQRRRQRWVWGSIAAAIALGSVALAWSYIPGGKESSLIDHPQAPEPDSAAE